eukprot:gene3933-7509_t
MWWSQQPSPEPRHVSRANNSHNAGNLLRATTWAALADWRDLPGRLQLLAECVQPCRHGAPEPADTLRGNPPSVHPAECPASSTHTSKCLGLALQGDGGGAMALNESNGRGGRANFDVAHAAK